MCVAYIVLSLQQSYKAGEPYYPPTAADRGGRLGELLAEVR